MVSAMQVGVRMTRQPTPYSSAQLPAQVAPQQVVPATEFGIGTLLTDIMPLIMIMMVFMMITPMMKGMSGGMA